MIHFFASAPLFYTTYIIKKTQRTETKIPVEHTAKMPTFEDFAASINISYSLLKKWANDPQKPAFQRAYTRAMELQRQWLIDNANAGRIHPNFAMFLGFNMFNMKKNEEKKEEGKTVNVTQIYLPETKRIDNGSTTEVEQNRISSASVLDKEETEHKDIQLT